MYFRKLPECHTCQFNARSQYIVCAVHPSGCKEESCLDFRLGNNVYVEPSWAPDGYEFYNGELISSANTLTYLDRLQLIENHPLFTKLCPKCDREFKDTPEVHWDCDRCGWIDDSVV